MKLNLFRKIAAAFGGYDIFISYRHVEAEHYAKRLHELLEERKLVVFRDESEDDNLGTSTDQFAKLATKARCFVTIVTPEIYQSESVYKELSSYLSARMGNLLKRPFSRMISIDVGQSLSKAGTAQENWQMLANYVYEPESLSALQRGEPSLEVLGRLAKAGTFMNSWRRFILGLSVTILSLILLTTGAYVYLTGLRSEIMSTQDKLQSVSDSVRLLDSQKVSLGLEKLQLQKDAVVLKKTNLVLEEGKNLLELDKQKLVLQSSALSAQAQKLDLRVEMLNYRASAMTALEDDPILSYRFAEKAFLKSPDAKNRELIQSSISSIDFYYESLFKNYSILDSKAPYVLVANKGSKQLAVYNALDAKFWKMPVKASCGWIIPQQKNWKILTQRYATDTPFYQLWNSNGVPVGSEVSGGRLSEPQFIGEDLVSIRNPRENKLLLWNLSSDKRTFENEIKSESFSPTYYYDIYGAMDTRRDGIGAGHYSDGLALYDHQKRVDTASYTAVEFDPSSICSRAKWSADDRYLALNYFDSKRLGIWEPTRRKFIWLDPDGWVVNAYSWSQSGHQLAFSGRTSNRLDVTVEVVDAVDPSGTRQVVYKGNVPIQSIVFLPGDKQLMIADKDSRALIIDLKNRQVMGSAWQSDIIKSAATKFYSSNKNGFRVWNRELAPARNWTFVSDSVKTYQSSGAAARHWAAVPFYRRSDKVSGIELRNLLNGQVRDIPYISNYEQDILFSSDGEWLVVGAKDRLIFWRTGNSNRHELILPKGAILSSKMAAKKEEVYVSGSDSGKSNSFIYVIDLHEGMPKLKKRVRFDAAYFDRKQDASYFDSISLGWKLNSLYTYRSFGWISSGSSDWVMRVTCRDQALGASDCDIQFVPLNLPWLMATYNKLLWQPDADELQVMSENQKKRK